MNQVFLDDFVDVVLIHVCIPDPFRVHDDGRALLASVQAARHVDPNLALTGKTQRLDFGLGIVAHLLGTAFRTAYTAVLAIIDAEKDMTTIIGCEFRHSCN